MSSILLTLGCGLALLSCYLVDNEWYEHCGDGIVQGAEECDDGNDNDHDACTNVCMAAVCGDGIVEPGVEACDDGNGIAEDACTNTCDEAVCGDGIVQAGVEECDDGGVGSYWCIEDCKFSACGNGIIDGSEACDDGNDNFNDACVHCMDAACGDGVVHFGVEACDDGNLENGDGCSDSCELLSVCGDGILDAGEQCDDGNLVNGDGCSDTCELTSTCGDGVVDAGEACDDGNLENGDGCSDTCELAACGDGVVDVGEQCDDGSANGTDGSSCTSACVVCADSKVSEIAVGEHTCVLLGCGKVQCWGSGAGGRLGYGNTDDVGDMPHRTPALVGPLDLEVSSSITGGALAAGSMHSCALLAAGGLACWGHGGQGRLGYGNTDNIGDTSPAFDDPPIVLGGGANVETLTAGDAHTCALLESEQVICWGFGEQGRLGYQDTVNVGQYESLANVDAVDVGYAVAGVDAGGAHTCALLNNGSALCWGAGGDGRLGYGNTDNVGDTPAHAITSQTPILGGNQVGIIQLTAGGAHTCVLTTDADVLCWGEGAQGQLGSGDTIDLGDTQNTRPQSLDPVDLGGRTMVQVSAGAVHTCARSSDKEVFCWGYGGDGRLGYGDTASRLAPGGPVDLGGLLAEQVVAGAAHTCAVVESGDVICWGFGGDGRLGYGSTANVGDGAAPGAMLVPHR